MNFDIFSIEKFNNGFHSSVACVLNLTWVFFCALLNSLSPINSDMSIHCLFSVTEWKFRWLIFDPFVGIYSIGIHIVRWQSLHLKIILWMIEYAYRCIFTLVTLKICCCGWHLHSCQCYRLSIKFNGNSVKLWCATSANGKCIFAVNMNLNFILRMKVIKRISRKMCHSGWVCSRSKSLKVKTNGEENWKWSDRHNECQ